MSMPARDPDSTPDHEELIRRHMPLVGHIVRGAMSRVPVHVSRDDLASAGFVALVQAARSYDPDRGVDFGAYASTRIRGAILDELRSKEVPTERTTPKPLNWVQVGLSETSDEEAPEGVAVTRHAGRADQRPLGEAARQGARPRWPRTARTGVQESLS